MRQLLVGHRCKENRVSEYLAEQLQMGITTAKVSQHPRAQANALKRRLILCLYGAFAAFFIYGGIIDLWTILGMTAQPVWETFLLVYTVALPFNLIHTIATVFFLYLIANPMINKLERVKLKYGAFR